MQLVSTQDPSNEIVRMSGLQKSFGTHDVLSGVDLSFRRGEIVAIVGPNGAGKTTLIKCLLGLVRPDGGIITVDGKPVTDDPTYRRTLGYMPQHAHFPENLTGREVLALIRAVRGGGEQTDLELQRTLDLERELDKPVRTLSGGTRQKISAVIAFMFRPRLLVLDEPTAGLDPVASTALKDHLRAVRAAGSGVILTSHVMSDIEALSDRIVFLLDGRVRFAGSLNELRDETGEQSLERAIGRLLKRDAA